MTLHELLARLKQIEHMRPELCHKEVEVECSYDAGLCAAVAEVDRVEIRCGIVCIKGKDE